MDDLLLKIWFAIGIFCIVAELILPGLVVIFIGLGAFTVILALHFNLINDLNSQLITFFVSSTIYVLTLRFLFLRLIPTNTSVQNTNEDLEVIGQTVDVLEPIGQNLMGRISHSDSSWQAKFADNNETRKILKGQKVEIVNRENITWLVKVIE